MDQDEPRPPAPATTVEELASDTRVMANLRHWAIRLCGSAERADDLMQDMFVSLLRVPPGRYPELTPGLVVTIIRRRFIDEERRRWREQERLEQLGYLESFDAAWGDPIDLGRLAATEEMIQKLGPLTERQRQVYFLADCCHWPHREVADALGLGVPTVRNYLSIARRHLGEPPEEE